MPTATSGADFQTSKDLPLLRRTTTVQARTARSRSAT